MMEAYIEDQISILRSMAKEEKTILWEDWYKDLLPIGKPSSTLELNLSYFEEKLKETLGQIVLERRIIPRESPTYHIRYEFSLHGQKFRLDYVFNKYKIDKSAFRMGKPFIVERGITYGMSFTIDKLFECELYNWNEDSIIDLIKSVGHYIPEWDPKIKSIDNRVNESIQKLVEKERLQREKWEADLSKRQKLYNLKEIKHQAIIHQFQNLLQAASFDVTPIHSFTSVRLLITAAGHIIDGHIHEYSIYIKIPKQKQRKIRTLLLSYLYELLEVIDDVQYLGKRSITDRYYNRTYYSQSMLFEEEINKKTIQKSKNDLYISLFNQAEKVLKDYNYRLFVRDDQVRCFIHTKYGWNTNTRIKIQREGNTFALLAEAMKTISKLQELFHSGFTFSRI